MTEPQTAAETATKHSAVNTLIDTYLNAWIEPDRDRRAALIEKCWTPDGALVDPPLEGHGVDGISELMAALQDGYPGHTFVRTSEIDQHHDTFRFTWELRAPDGGVAVAGTDVGCSQRTAGCVASAASSAN